MSLQAPALLQYRDLPHNAVLALSIWRVGEAVPVSPLGGTTMRLFSKQGRLKTGAQKLQVWRGREADTAWPGATPGKLPVAQRGEIGLALLLVFIAAPRQMSAARCASRGSRNVCITWLLPPWHALTGPGLQVKCDGY